MPTVAVAREQVRYRCVEAEGAFAPRIVLLHMAGGSSLSWAPVLRLLGKKFSVYAPDFPAHGQSQGRARASVDDMARFADQFCEALGLGRVHVAGHSMGGAVALAWALQHPARVRSLSLVSTAARLRVAPAMFDLIDRHFDQLGHLMGGAARASRSTEVAGSEAVFPQAEQATVRMDFEACQAFDASAELHRIDQPCAVLVGREDALTPVSWAELLEGGLGQARLHVVEGCGHLLPRERPRLVAEIIADLVRPDLE